MQIKERKRVGEKKENNEKDKSDITIRRSHRIHILYIWKAHTSFSSNIHTHIPLLYNWMEKYATTWNYFLLIPFLYFIFLGWKSEADSHTHTHVVYMKVFENLCIIASNCERGRRAEDEKIVIWHLNFKCGLVDVTLRWNIQRSFFITHHFFLFVPQRLAAFFSFSFFSVCICWKVIILPWYDAHMLPFSATFALICLIQLLYVSPLHIQHDSANVMEYEKCGINFKWKFEKMFE